MTQPHSDASLTATKPPRQHQPGEAKPGFHYTYSETIWRAYKGGLGY